MIQNTNAACYGLGIASVPIQQWGEVYRPETAFCNGTIFPALYMPYFPPTANSASKNPANAKGGNR